MAAVLLKPAADRYAEVGDLYDARTEVLSSVNVFRTLPPSSVLQSVDITEAIVDYAYLDTFSKVVDYMSLDFKATLSLLFGLIKIKGAAGVSVFNTKTAKHVSHAITYNVATKLDYLRVSDQRVSGYLRDHVLDNPSATHIVVGIEWGAKTNFVFDQLITTNTVSADKRGKGLWKLGAEALYAIFKGVYQGSGNIKTLKVEVYADVTPGCMRPSNLEQLREYTSLIPAAIARLNGGRGRQLRYHLMPIESFAKLHGIAANVAPCRLEVDDAVRDACVQYLADVSELRLRLVERQRLLENDDDMTAPSVNQTVLEILETLTRYEQRTKDALQRTLVDARSGRLDVKSLTRSLDRPKLGEISRQVSDLEPHVTRVHFIKYLKSKGVVYISRQNVNTELLQRTNQRVYMLMSSVLHEDSFETNCLFVKLLNDKHCFMFVNLDLQDKLRVKYKETKICSYLNKYDSHDVKHDLEVQREKCCARSRVRPKLVAGRPRRVTRLLVPCPGMQQGLCSAEPRTWLCAQCDAVIQYGQDNFLYCDCGRSLSYLLEFSCSGHEEYFQFNDLATVNIIHSLKLNVVKVSLDAKNFAPLWVTSFVLLLTFDDLDAARCNRFQVLPSSDQHEALARVGSEDQPTEQSVYNVNLGTHMLRIDTAGGTDEGVRVLYLQDGDQPPRAAKMLMSVEDGCEFTGGYKMATGLLTMLYDESKELCEAEKAQWKNVAQDSRKLAEAIIQAHNNKKS